METNDQIKLGSSCKFEAKIKEIMLDECEKCKSMTSECESSGRFDMPINESSCTGMNDDSAKCILYRYIDYWDEVIDKWFYDVIDKEQKPFLKLYFQGKYQFQMEYMPEPYWGDPLNCSIVIINYNPAGGDDQNSFTWKEFADCCKIRMVSYVKQHKYSNLAIPFPIINDDADCPDFLRKYGGRNWWLGKKQWSSSIVEYILHNDENVPPFGLELCGWHSEKWNSNFTDELKPNKELCNSVIKYFVLPLIAAIKMSKTQIGLCVGKKLGKLLDAFGCDITKRIVKHITNYKSYNNDDGIKPNDKERYYRVYKICDEYIINTWSIGSNKHPSEDFHSFEKQLIDAILQLKNGNKQNKAGQNNPKP